LVNLGVYDDIVPVIFHILPAGKHRGDVPDTSVCTMCKKTAPFCFCNNFVKSSSILILFGTHIPQ